MCMITSVSLVTAYTEYSRKLFQCDRGVSSNPTVVSILCSVGPGIIPPFAISQFSTADGDPRERVEGLEKRRN